MANHDSAFEEEEIGRVMTELRKKNKYVTSDDRRKLCEKYNVKKAHLDRCENEYREKHNISTPKLRGRPKKVRPQVQDLKSEATRTQEVKELPITGDSASPGVQVPNANQGVQDQNSEDSEEVQDPNIENCKDAALADLQNIKLDLDDKSEDGNKRYKEYSAFLSLVFNGKWDIPEFLSHFNYWEEIVFAVFKEPMQATTDSKNRKLYYNYLYLDPLVLKLDEWDKLPTDLDRFRAFVEGIFYVGKAKDTRSLQHLKDVRDDKKDNEEKKVKIKKIWEAGRGVIVLRVFNYITDDEALTREKCLINAIGVKMLTNKNSGTTVQGVRVELEGTEPCQLGVHLLYKAYQAFIIDRRQELFPFDLGFHEDVPKLTDQLRSQVFYVLMNELPEHVKKSLPQTLETLLPQILEILKELLLKQQMPPPELPQKLAIAERSKPLPEMEPKT